MIQSKKVSHENNDKQPLMYTEFAEWWPLLSSPVDYEEEATIFYNVILKYSNDTPKTMLELGSGGGNNASYLKKHFALTLVDRSTKMLEVSRKLNPGIEHIEGDMRHFRLDRFFDCVFIHDAISYITSETDLRLALETAFIHCRPGGVALFVPDNTKENFKPMTKHGGHDSQLKAMRYLEWNYDPDPDDSTYICDFAYLHRNKNGTVTCSYDRHILGLFKKELWLSLIKDVGFEPRVIPFEHSEFEPDSSEMFIGLKPV